MSEIEDKWRALLTGSGAPVAAPVRAMTYLETRHSASRPVKVSGSDGRLYFVKGGHAGRQLVNDQLVGRLGMALGSPNATVAHVEISSDLVDIETQLHNGFGNPGRFAPGVWHGSLVIDDVSNEREGFAHHGEPENRARFARLAILYGWTHGSDHQFVYNNQPPRLVHSYDHGHFFPSGPEWNIGTLTGAGLAVPDVQIVTSCGLTPDEIRAASDNLAALDPDAVILAALGNVLDHWNVSLDEKIALAVFLETRRRQLLDHIATLP